MVKAKAGEVEAKVSKVRCRVKQWENPEENVGSLPANPKLLAKTGIKLVCL